MWYKNFIFDDSKLNRFPVVEVSVQLNMLENECTSEATAVTVMIETCTV